MEARIGAPGFIGALYLSRCLLINCRVMAVVGPFVIEEEALDFVLSIFRLIVRDW